MFSHCQNEHPPIESMLTSAAVEAKRKIAPIVLHSSQSKEVFLGTGGAKKGTQTMFCCLEIVIEALWFR